MSAPATHNTFINFSSILVLPDFFTTTTLP
jgi:hypothetical protein